jgi:hypothetical protein
MDYSQSHVVTLIEYLPILQQKTLDRAIKDNIREEK